MITGRFVRVLRPLAGALAVAALSACVGPFASGRSPTHVEAVLPRANNLFEGSDVRVLGVAVGRVVALDPAGQTVVARMEIDPEVEIPADARAIVSPTSLLGERFLQLEPPYTGGPVLADGARIPLDRAGVPAEVDEVLASFERFLAGLDSQTLAELVDVLAETLAGQGQELNRLLDQGSTTVRVLADSSDDLNAIVRELADLNSALATRDEQIGQTLEDWSTVVRLVGEESDQIVQGVDNLRRLTAELRPLTDAHADQLVTDLEVLTTSLATVDRNLERLGTLVAGSRALFDGFGRAFDYPEAQLRLDDETEELGTHIERRLTDRLVGLCLRLELPDCASPEFWEPHLPALLCLDGLVACTPDKTSLSRALAQLLGLLPAEAQRQVVAEAQARAAERERPPPDAGPPPPPAPVPTVPGGPGGPLMDMPLPDPRLQSQPPPDSLQDRLARLIGGG